MALAPGGSLGPYEIIALLGAGGMGEVYRARDAKLGRDVALKLLPEELAADAEWSARFEREARLLAALNHPNIAAIYGVEDSGPRRALVMELVEGPTLAERLRRGRLPIDEALRIARAIAEGIEYAHERGVVHRDLKPSNIKLRPDGAVKILDLGLARTLRPAMAAAEPGQPSAKSEFMTKAGMLLGTAAYMSPEQARGKEVDGRADIFTFGGVLFEMLTGRMAFRGETATDTLSAVLKADPDWSRLPTDTPPRVRALLRRCLAKDPDRRLHDIADARIEIEEVIAARAGLDSESAASGGAPAPAVRASRRQKVRWALSGVGVVALVAAVSALTGIWPPARPAAAHPRRLSIVHYEGSEVGAPAISPDGRRIAYPARNADGTPMLWVRDLDSFVSRPLAGTEGGHQPFWSPDSKDLGFFAGWSLKRVPADGGPVQVLFPEGWGGGGAWAPDGTIIFSPGEQSLLRISAAGGEAKPATTTPSEDWGHLWPSFLPGGRRFLFTARKPSQSSEISRQGIYIGSLDSPEVTQLLPDLSSAFYAPPGYIVFVRDGKLTAAPFDLAAGRISGSPRPLGEAVAVEPLRGLAALSVATDGTLALRAPPACALGVSAAATQCDSELRLIDRAGRVISSSVPLRLMYGMALAPDGRRVAAQIADQRVGAADLWIVDLVSGARNPITTTSGFSNSPAWSPDGARLAYANPLPDGSSDTCVKDFRTGEVTKIVQTTGAQPTDWSHDGRHLLLAKISRAAVEVVAWSFASRKLAPVSSAGGGAFFSPDGRFVAFNSVNRATGRMEAYVTNFPARGQVWPLTSAGGSAFSWRADGREILVATMSGHIAAYPVSADKGFTAGSPTILVRDVGFMNAFSRATPDHSRILIRASPEAGKDQGEIRLLVDWAAAIEKEP